jgi:hypothetical protein
VLHKKFNVVKIYQKMEYVLPYIVKLFVYILSYVDCLLANSGSNWFIYVDGGVLMEWSRGK